MKRSGGEIRRSQGKHLEMVKAFGEERRRHQEEREALNESKNGVAVQRHSRSKDTWVIRIKLVALRESDSNEAYLVTADKGLDGERLLQYYQAILALIAVLPGHPSAYCMQYYQAILALIAVLPGHPSAYCSTTRPS